MQQDNLFGGGELESLHLPGADISLWRHWLPHDRALALYANLRDSLPWTQPEIILGGRTVPIPRLQVWFGDEDARYVYSGTTFTPVPWPKPLTDLKQQVEVSSGCRFNSLLANFYRDGNDSVAYHADDERELGQCPVIASLSLGETRRFLLKPKPGGALVHPGVSIELANGDLLVMAGATQKHWQHSVPKSRKPHSGRINLTFRFIDHKPNSPKRDV